MTVLPLPLRATLLVVGTGACLVGCATPPSPAVGPSASPLLRPSTQPSAQITSLPTPAAPVVSPVASPVVSALPELIASPSSQATTAPSAAPQATPSPVAFQTISQIIDLRCSTCHGFNGGVSLRSSEQILQAVPRIQVRVLEQKSMPPGGLPEAERALIGRWIAEGAKLNP
jgi:mono/diheme cytochrome c family protein